MVVEHERYLHPVTRAVLAHQRQPVTRENFREGQHVLEAIQEGAQSRPVERGRHARRAALEPVVGEHVGEGVPGVPPPPLGGFIEGEDFVASVAEYGRDGQGEEGFGEGRLEGVVQESSALVLVGECVCV